MEKVNAELLFTITCDNRTKGHFIKLVEDGFTSRWKYFFYTSDGRLLELALCTRGCVGTQCHQVHGYQLVDKQILEELDKDSISDFPTLYHPGLH